MKAGRHENVQMRINISSTRAKGTTTAATVAKFHVKNFINANVRKCTAQKHLNSRIELLCNQNFTLLQIASNRVKVSFHYFTSLYIGVSKNMQKNSTTFNIASAVWCTVNTAQRKAFPVCKRVELIFSFRNEISEKRRSLSPSPTVSNAFRTIPNAHAENQAL